jgi:hypothetical protein
LLSLVVVVAAAAEVTIVLPQQDLILRPQYHLVLKVAKAKTCLATVVAEVVAVVASLVVLVERTALTMPPVVKGDIPDLVDSQVVAHTQ